MKRLQQWLTVAIVTLSLGISGCMARQEPQKSPEKQEKQGEKQGNSKAQGGGGGRDKKETDPIKEGAEKTQSKLADLEAALKTGDTNEVRKQARAVDDAWEDLERKLETKNPQAHDDIEANLNNVLAGSVAVPFNNNVISSEIEKLDQKLDELKKTKGKPEEPKKVDVKTGAAAMRHNLVELRTAVASGDTAQMQDKAKAVDRSWAQFEGKVKEQSKDDYRELEDSLHTILAGVKASPPDTQKVQEEIGKLDTKLAELSK